MDSHFVENNLGKYYISSEDIGNIKDNVIFTYDDEDKSEPYSSLCWYFMKDLILFRNTLEEKLCEYNAGTRGLKPAIMDIKYEIVNRMDELKETFKSLLDEGLIDEKTYTRLVKKFNKLVGKQLNYIDAFDYSQIDLKSMKAKTKKKTDDK